MYKFALKHTAIERFVTLSHGAGEKEHKMKCCSCSCKINLDGRWTRMSVFDILAHPRAARAHELGCPENVCSYSNF